MTEYREYIELPGGMRVFVTTDGDLVFADQSGHTPETTDDGPQYAIKDADLHVVADTQGGYRESVLAPCLDKDGNGTYVWMGFADALILAVEYGFKIRAGKDVFTVTGQMAPGIKRRPTGTKAMRITKTTTEVFE